MVESPAKIAFDRISEAIVPECVLAAFVAVLSKDVNKPPLHDVVECGGYFGAITDTSQKALGVVNIDGRRCDVQISQPNDGVSGPEMPVEIVGQSLEPLQLVLEHFGVRAAALWDVGVYDCDAVDDGTDETRLIPRFVVETAGDVFDGFSADDCDAVIALLPLEEAIVAGAFERLCWKIVVLHLCFLQAENVGGLLF